MKFGQVEDPGQVDFTLPDTHSDTINLLNATRNKAAFKVSIGCAKWNKQDLKGFYPRGTKDELSYYANQFNAIELNATFYNAPDKQQVLTWKNKVPADFKFFPKLPNQISHYRRLLNAEEPTIAFCDAISFFEEKLGMAFLQLHDNFKPTNLDRLSAYLSAFPKGIPLAVEVRNEEWFQNKEIFDEYSNLLKEHRMANIIVDTAGRRDMLHMRLTSPEAFIRYVGANHSSDYERLDRWIDRIQEWRSEGLQSLYFFVHQNIERESPLLSSYFIEKLNSVFDLDLHVPKGLAETGEQAKLL
ncbi:MULTISPECIES: DUF72 domain-containing protein [Olivibacter]|jgi:uncharacterized protein YecE (DUF72 family)|uniref:DUF72 domain-containing protein n=1 Tax=Olivibacter oleidegradans TaxID=760123 RepID=A0ABV6HTJ1_9SPHI|nr:MULTISPECIES: DUF72 domain-containing protein [Olivibacter]MDM8174001.1 DUF72 domain-containing protein [Olivibacter sp. 47]MDX3916919.1 DUF72 domain-containing protein [Pseudosphingobacterium sp.]QEL03786.1 DUF72 domain-containing protein [Olivibacter sp. LS-1]